MLAKVLFTIVMTLPAAVGLESSNKIDVSCHYTGERGPHSGPMTVCKLNDED